MDGKVTVRLDGRHLNMTYINTHQYIIKQVTVRPDGMHLNMTYINTHHYSIKGISRTYRYNEESWQAGQHTSNTGIYSKAT